MPFPSLSPVVGAAAGAFAAQLVQRVATADTFAEIFTGKDSVGPSSGAEGIRGPANGVVDKIGQLQDELTSAVARLQSSLKKTLSHAGIDIGASWTLTAKRDGAVEATGHPSASEIEEAIAGSAELRASLDDLLAKAGRLREAKQWQRFEMAQALDFGAARNWSDGADSTDEVKVVMEKNSARLLD